ncbi:uncharacterized protein [Eurosta solidaginis]|uniref:uncharacterized protein n=1 Tax=Eurosta solidaginis TaxID=178769 RepID=UPI003530D8E8
MESDLKNGNANKNSTIAKDGIKINALKLIRLVRGHEELYNSLAAGYTNRINKDGIWEGIIRGLYPLFDTYQPPLKESIRTSVRRRWKTLRDSVSREVKRSVTLENFSRKKGSPIISELEFLIPHIRTTHCAKLADEMGLRESYATSKGNDVQPQDEDSSYINNNSTNDDSSNDLVDLTDECDIKPFIKQDSFAYDDMDIRDDSYPLSPQDNFIEDDSVVNNTNASQTTVETDDSIRFCTVAQFKGGEFINPPELCTDYDGGVELVSLETEKEAEREKSASTIELNGKRTRSLPEEPVKQQQPSVHDLQAKILQLLSSIESRDRSEYEATDEDRMFLLSLVSDLKRVPADKKMRIKMEIVTAIAGANQ